MVTKLKAVCVTDVDGVLSNGVIYLPNGERARIFSPEDGHGFHLLINAGIYPIICSGENDACIAQRASKLKVPFVYSKNKAHDISRLLEENDLTGFPLAAIGNDLPDLDLLQKADFPACPADAWIINHVRGMTNNYICTSKGGEGAFREFVHYLLGRL